MNGQRPNGIRTKWNSGLANKMNNAVFRTTVEPRNNHITLSKSKGYDRGFPGGAVVENLPANAGDAGSSLVLEDPTCHGATGSVSHNC